MGNHYHLLIETPDGNLAKGMRQLNGIYTQKFNRIHKRVGHIFQGRYKAFLIEDCTYFREVARYIVLNPVRAKMVKHPKDWTWSNYNATAGFMNAPSWLTRDWTLGKFHEKRLTAQKKYQKFVLDGIDGPNPFDEIEEGTILGFPQFIAWVWEEKNSSEEIKEIPIKERFVNRPSLDSLLPESERKDRKMRNWMIQVAHINAGYSQKEIADHTEIHYTWISKIINQKL